jgi:hypothetical protein
MNRFWEGGPKVYGGALRQQFRAERDKLRVQAAAAQTDAERHELQTRIVRLTDAYGEKSRAIGRNLF